MLMYRDIIQQIINTTEMFPDLKRESFSILQLNLGYRCNQSCSHCHVDASPYREEMMSQKNIDLVIEVMDKYHLSCIDLTGGAPELHDKFRYLVKEARHRDIEVIDRCNLTILSETGQGDLASFLANNNVTIIASLPCYEKENVDKQRGKGVFEKSIKGLVDLNKLGYGKSDGKLKLNLVYNPQGASLPAPQAELEKAYHKILQERYGIEFNHLYTITNMPIQRFEKQLRLNNEFEAYMKLLKHSHNPINLNNVMCKEIISVNWKGELYDCDFNQMLSIEIGASVKTLESLVKHQYQFLGERIAVGDHCYGCTAGSGSSCGGALINE